MKNETSIHESPTTSNPLSSAQDNLPNNASDNPNQPYYYDDADAIPARLDEKQTNWAGIALIIVGALFFFNSVNVQGLFMRLSPLILVALGVYRMRQSDDPEEERHSRRLIFIGAMIFVFTSGLLRVVGALLPIALIIGGIYMLNRQYFDEGDWRNNRWVQRISEGARELWHGLTQRISKRRSQRQLRTQGVSGNSRNAASAPAEWVVFGSSQKHISEAKRNLATRSIFGEMEVDLRPLEGKIKQGEMHLHVQTVFAETRVIVPDSWQVNVDNNAILGEVSNRSNSNTDGTVTLHVEGSTVFGETRISN